MAQSALVPAELPRSVALFDLSYSFRRHWHAQNADAEVNDAPRAVLAEMASVRAAVDHVIVCVDSPPYFRKELYPAYKAQREAPSDGMKAAMKWLKGRIDADGYQVAAAPTFEADDCIMTLATAYLDDYYLDAIVDIRMVGCDKDLAQRVYGVVTQYVPAVGNRPAVVLDMAGVVEKFGVTPAQIPEYLALVGDSSDNIEGVTGIGPKRAAQILQAYGSLTELYADLESDSDRDMKLPLSDKMIGTLRFAKANVFRDVQLTTLRTDVPLDAMALLARKEVQKLVEVPTVEDVMPEIDDVPISPPPGVTRLTPLPPRPGQVQRIEEPTEAIVVAASAPSWALSLQPNRASDALLVAKTLYNSRLYAKFDNPEQIFAVIMRGRELGIGMTTALDSFSVIKGRPTPSADLIQALCERDPDCDYFMLVESTPEVARYEVKRKSHPKAVPFSYSMADAQKAGLASNDNYKKNPAAMLRARGKSSAGRAMFPGATCGLFCPEEMEGT